METKQHPPQYFCCLNWLNLLITVVSYEYGLSGWVQLKFLARDEVHCSRLTKFFPLYPTGMSIYVFSIGSIILIILVMHLVEIMSRPVVLNQKQAHMLQGTFDHVWRHFWWPTPGAAGSFSWFRWGIMLVAHIHGTAPSTRNHAFTNISSAEIEKKLWSGMITVISSCLKTCD